MRMLLFFEGAGNVRPRDVIVYYATIVISGTVVISDTVLISDAVGILNAVR